MSTDPGLENKVNQLEKRIQKLEHLLSQFMTMKVDLRIDGVIKPVIILTANDISFEAPPFTVVE